MNKEEFLELKQKQKEKKENMSLIEQLKHEKYVQKMSLKMELETTNSDSSTLPQSDPINKEEEE